MGPTTSFFLYKTICLIVGFGVIYLGYILFMKGIFGKAGDLATEHGKSKLKLTNGAPGTFFALFGAFIIVVAIFKKFEVKDGMADIKDMMTRQLPDSSFRMNDSSVIK
jgi:hypothetical protein